MSRRESEISSPKLSLQFIPKQQISSFEWPTRGESKELENSILAAKIWRLTIDREKIPLKLPFPVTVRSINEEDLKFLSAILLEYRDALIQINQKNYFPSASSPNLNVRISPNSWSSVSFLEFLYDDLKNSLGIPILVMGKDSPPNWIKISREIFENLMNKKNYQNNQENKNGENLNFISSDEFRPIVWIPRYPILSKFFVDLLNWKIQQLHGGSMKFPNELPISCRLDLAVFSRAKWWN